MKADAVTGALTLADWIEHDAGGRRLPSPYVVGAVGGGGKTTTLIELFRAALRPRMILTTTTAMMAPTLPGHPFLPLPLHLETIHTEPPATSGVWFGSPFDGITNKYRGVGRDELDRWVRAWRRHGDRDTMILCEADGSKRKPLKTHADHEPVLPETTDVTVIFFGLSGLGRPMGDDVVHRSERFMAQSGLALGEPIAFEHLLRVLRSGGLCRGIPRTSRVAVVFNQVDVLDEPATTIARWGDATLELPRIDAVFFQGARNGRPHVAYGRAADRSKRPRFSAVLMAAGTSSRMGDNKLLLPVDGEPMVVRSLRHLLRTDVDEIVVVTGHEHTRVMHAIAPWTARDARVKCVVNDRYREGQGTSVAAGARTIDPESAACFFVPADQPLIDPAIFRRLAEASAPNTILLPSIEGHRATPSLFDRAYFDELASLDGDRGGRQVLDRHPDRIREIPWSDRWTSFDVDTPEAYDALLDHMDPR
ncbi:MAG: selenium cofactor biosynthesis protein YqeC [Saccharofermentanales bacterium]|jgi:probable selenium-dependent hydroxylase accessory protein YqeC